jgi:anti-sigma B factor antagonist
VDRREIDTAWVEVAGEVDIATALKLERTLYEALTEARLVVLDLCDLTFMDSSGVHAIVRARDRARQAASRLILVRGPAHVHRLLALTGASEHLEIGDLGPTGADNPSAPPARRTRSRLMPDPGDTLDPSTVPI